MPDYGAPVINPEGGAGLQPALQATQLLSSIVGIGRQATALQTEKQQLHERMSVVKMMQTGMDDQGNSILDANKEPDPVKILPALGRIAPLTGQDYAQNILKTHADKIGLQAASTSLDAGQRNMLSGIAQSFISNPKATSGDFNDAVDNLVEKHPEMAGAANYAKNIAASHIDKADPTQRPHMWESLSALMQTPQSVPTAPVAGTIDTGAGKYPVTTEPQTGAITPAPGVTLPKTAEGGVSQQLPPGLVEVTGADGNKYFANQQDLKKTVIAGQGENIQQPGEKPAAPEKPSNTAPPVLTIGEGGPGGQIEQNTKNVTANRQLAADTQINNDVLNRIQSIAATPGLYLGPGSQSVADLATAVSKMPGFEGAAKYANNYNELAKFMATNAARVGKQLGLEGSDNRLDLALHATPNTQQDVRTVQSIAQYMNGLNRMQAAKADSMENWLRNPANGGYRQEHHFEELWRDNADPRLFQLAVMKDQGEAQNYVKLHVRPQEAKALKEKAAILQHLGALPSAGTP